LDQVTVSEIEFSPPLVLSFMSAEPVVHYVHCHWLYSHNWYITYAAFIIATKLSSLAIQPGIQP